MNVFQELQWRELISNATEGTEGILATESLAGYIGFDPSAASLHVGSLLPIMVLARFQRFGHTPIAIVGGGTGLIGDPSGKAQERVLLTKEQVEINLEGIRAQLSKFLDFEAKRNPAIIINNADWLTTVTMMDFLRDIGKNFTVNYMLNKEAVSRRLDQEHGISFTEFCYMLLQAYDFLVLYERHNCVLQMGGSDQWGNILAGIELIRRLKKASAYGLVFPLVTSTTGTKFGKTESGAVWLDANLTSPFRFFQFWLNVDDKDVITYLKYFTWLSQDEIMVLAEATASSPEKREAQRTLAREVTRLTHGETSLFKAERASRILFGERIADVGTDELEDIFGDAPSSALSKNQFEGGGLSVIELAVNCGLASSRAEARRLIKSGGLYLNNSRLTDSQHSVSLENLLDGKLMVLRKGQKQYHVVKVID